MTPEARAYRDLILFIAEEIAIAEDDGDLALRWIGNLWATTSHALKLISKFPSHQKNLILDYAWQMTLSSVNCAAEPGDHPETFLRLTAKIEELKARIIQEKREDI